MKISVAMTTWNGEGYLASQLDSLHGQLRPADELVICDDCSTDSTWTILNSFRDAHPDMQVRLYRNAENIGYIRNFRQAAELCGGDLIFFCDQDDIWDREKISVLSGLMEEHPEIQALASSFSMIDADDRPHPVRLTRGWANNNLYPEPVADGALACVPPEYLIFQNICQGCALVIRSGLRDRFLETFTDTLHHDWQINLLAASSGGLYFYNQSLFRYRIHPDNTLGLVSSDSWQSRTSFAARSAQDRDALSAAGQLHRIEPGIYAGNPGVRKRVRFLKEHLRNLKQKRTGRLLLQMADPLYREFRQSWRGRMADLICTLRP